MKSTISFDEFKLNSDGMIPVITQDFSKSRADRSSLSYRKPYLFLYKTCARGVKKYKQGKHRNYKKYRKNR